MTTTAPAPPPGMPTGNRPPVEHSLGPFSRGRPAAPWGLRVLATLLDSALVASVVFLATGAEPTLAALPGLGRPGGTGGAAWTAGTLLMLGAFQAYTGMTPGKRVTGIAVVDDGSGRPIGLLGTVLRWLAHLLDAIFLVGYLRAAFRRDGRTFADSLLGTVAVRTTTPVPHPGVARLRAARDARAPWLRWPRRLTGAVALVLCAAAAAMSVTSSSGGSTRMSEDETSCISTGDFAASAVLGSSRSDEWDSRLGITHVTRATWRVGVGWSTGLGMDSGDNPEVGATTATLSVRSPDGLTYDSAGSPTDDEAHPGLGDDAGDGLWWSVPDLVASTVIDAPKDVAGWTAHAVLRDGDGSVLAECSAPVPAIDAA